MRKSISIIIPAFNEADNLEAAVISALSALEGRITDYEILIFDDCSTDGTGEIADRLGATNSKIRSIHNPVNMGFGYNFTKGVELAQKPYVVMFPGDNEVTEQAMAALFDNVGKADIVTSYPVNTEVRSLMRRVISRLYVLILNTLFRLNLRYYNGACIHQTEVLCRVPMKTHGFAYMSNILIRMIKSGYTFYEVPIQLQPREHGRTSAFKLKNIVSVIRTIGSLAWEVYFCRSRSLLAEPG